MKKWIQLLLYGILGIGLLLLAIAYFFYVPDIAPEALNEKYGIKPSHYIEVNGMDVHYRVEGPAADTIPLVLLHGTSSSLFTWDTWTELLKDKHRVIRLDLPGFGLTGPHPEDDYRVETYLEFLQSFLAKLEVKQCIIVGNSLGGEIAWRYVLENPREVQKLILIGAAGYPVDIESLPLHKLPLSYVWLHIPWLRDLSVHFSTPRLIHQSLEYLYGDPDKVSKETVELYFDMARRKGNRDALVNRMEKFGRVSPLEQIPSIQTPTLIMWGGNDRLIPMENAWRFHRNLPNSILAIFAEAGHMPMEEIPYKSAEEAEKFLSRFPATIKKGANPTTAARGMNFLSTQTLQFVTDY
jgi:pimeloyl-ACP methyl ester carboxylesterase